MKKVILFLALLTWAPTSFAYQSLLTTGDLLEPDQFQIMGYIESIFDELDGVNVNARGTYGLNDEMQIDMEVGIGDLDIMLGGFLKWVPIPDYDKQPAIGVRAGVSYINTDAYSQTSISAMPFVSKGIPDTPHGKFTPYLGLPLAWNSNKNDDYFSARIVLGTEWTPAQQQDVHVVTELGLDLSKSFNSLSVAGSYDF